jgi:hypothetical protein
MSTEKWLPLGSWDIDRKQLNQLCCLHWLHNPHVPISGMCDCRSQPTANRKSLVKRNLTLSQMKDQVLNWKEDSRWLLWKRLQQTVKTPTDYHSSVPLFHQSCQDLSPGIFEHRMGSIFPAGQATDLYLIFDMCLSSNYPMHMNNTTIMWFLCALCSFLQLTEVHWLPRSLHNKLVSMAPGAISSLQHPE